MNGWDKEVRRYEKTKLVSNRNDDKEAGAKTDSRIFDSDVVYDWMYETDGCAGVIACSDRRKYTRVNG